MKGKYFVLLVAVLSILALSGCDALLVEKKGGGELPKLPVAISPAPGSYITHNISYFFN